MPRPYQEAFISEMRKPCHGSLSAVAASARFHALLADPETYCDVKNGHRRVRLAAEDHVKFQSKLARRKKLVISEPIKKNVTEEELKNMKVGAWLPEPQNVRLLKGRTYRATFAGSVGLFPDSLT